MSILYRAIAPEEFPAFARADSLAFGHLLSDADVEIERAALEFERAMAAFEDGAVVGTTASLSLELTVPGGAVLPVGGLTWAAVIPTHRRQGILSGMMERQLQISRDRGEPAVVLLASEGGIYGRYGYAPATWSVGFAVSTVFSEFRETPPAEGRCHMLEPSETARALPDIFDRHRRTRHGSLSRSNGLWQVLLADPEHHRDGAGRLYYVLYENGDGRLDGYVGYRLKHTWGDDGISRGDMIVTELMALTTDAYAALWRYCLDMDLTATVTATSCAPDEPVRWLLADPRQLRTVGVMDYLWLRLLDIEACLAARTYAAAGRVVIEAHEPDPNPVTADAAASTAAAPRRYLLDAGPDGATCTPTTRDADLVLDTATLSSVYLGGTSLGALARAGRVHEATPGALTLADTMFATARPPWCSTHF